MNIWFSPMVTINETRQTDRQTDEEIYWEKPVRITMKAQKSHAGRMQARDPEKREP